jgi:hypothetical protein
MATLEMVRLRSLYPNMGRMTVRYAVPRIDAPVTLDLDAALREVLTDTTDDTTTPQVGSAPQAEFETTAGKGTSPR